MIGRVRIVLLTLALSAAGCVNDYLVGEGGVGSSTGAPGSSSSSAGTDHGSSEAGSCADACGESTKADGDGTGHGDTTVGDTDGAFTCIACASDAECGGDYDNCSTFDMLGAVCVFACPEGGCPSGSSCRSVLSVDGVTAMQCAPMAGTCDPIGTDDGGDGTGGTTIGDPTTGEPTTTATTTGESMSGGAGEG
jgi:hypothetical protein